MRRLVGTGSGANVDSLIERIWLQKLPPVMRTIRPLLGNQPINSIALIFDGMYDESLAISHSPSHYSTTPFTVPVSAVTAPYATATTPQQVHAVASNNEVSILREQLNALTMTVNNLAKTIEKSVASAPSYCCNATDHPSRRRDRSGSPQSNRRRSPSRSPFRGNPSFYEGKCYYHHVYGSNARRCRNNCVEFNPKLDIVDASDDSKK